jgi:F-type H+-transporting ATPase subunit b
MSMKIAKIGLPLGLSTAISAVGSTGVLAAENDGGGTLPQLDIATYPSQLFWLLITFVVLYILLSKIALPRVAEVIESRQERVDNDLTKARQLREESDAVRLAYEQSLAESRAEAQAKVTATQAEINERVSAAEAEAAAKAANDLRAAEQRIASAAASALDNIRDVAIDVSGQAVSKLIGIDVDAGIVSQAVDQAIGEQTR